MTDKFVLYKEDANIHYPAPDDFMPDALSKEKGNLIRFGNDGGNYIDGNDILSNQAGNVLGISVIDGRVFYGGNGDVDIDISDYVSTDDCNLISVTTDGKLETLASTLVSADANNALTVGSDCKLHVTEGAAPQSDIVNSSGDYISTITIDTNGPITVPLSAARHYTINMKGYAAGVTTAELGITFDTSGLPIAGINGRNIFELTVVKDFVRDPADFPDPVTLLIGFNDTVPRTASFLIDDSAVSMSFKFRVDYIDGVQTVSMIPRHELSYSVQALDVFPAAIIIPTCYISGYDQTYLFNCTTKGESTSPTHTQLNIDISSINTIGNLDFYVILRLIDIDWSNLSDIKVISSSTESTTFIYNLHNFINSTTDPVYKGFHIRRMFGRVFAYPVEIDEFGSLLPLSDETYPTKGIVLAKGTNVSTTAGVLVVNQ